MGTPQSADDVRRILTGVLRGLAHLHCHGEIHGDLKPGNILLGQGGVVKVTDVGWGRGRGQRRRHCGHSRLHRAGVLGREARRRPCGPLLRRRDGLRGAHRKAPIRGPHDPRSRRGPDGGLGAFPAAHRVRVPADLERVVMRALEREAPLRQGSADEFMEGFGVEDRVGVILGGKFVDPDDLLPRVVRRAHRTQRDDPTLITLAGAPGSGKSEWLEQLNQAFVNDGVRCVLLPADERLTFGEALATEISSKRDGRPGHHGSPKDLVDLIRSAANQQASPFSSTPVRATLNRSSVMRVLSLSICLRTQQRTGTFLKPS